MKYIVLALLLLGLLQLSKVFLPYLFLVNACLGPEFTANSAIGDQSQSPCTPDIATPIGGTTDSGSSSGSGGDPGAAAIASYQVAGASAIVDLKVPERTSIAALADQLISSTLVAAHHYENYF